MLNGTGRSLPPASKSWRAEVLPTHRRARSADRKHDVRDRQSAVSACAPQSAVEVKAGSCRKTILGSTNFHLPSDPQSRPRAAQRLSLAQGPAQRNRFEKCPRLPCCRWRSPQAAGLHQRPAGELEAKATEAPDKQLAGREGSGQRPKKRQHRDVCRHVDTSQWVDAPGAGRTAHLRETELGADVD